MMLLPLRFLRTHHALADGNLKMQMTTWRTTEMSMSLGAASSAREVWALPPWRLALGASVLDIHRRGVRAQWPARNLNPCSTRRAP
jgi:hypothetical protein